MDHHSPPLGRAMPRRLQLHSIPPGSATAGCHHRTQQQHPPMRPISTQPSPPPTLGTPPLCLPQGPPLHRMTATTQRLLSTGMESLRRRFIPPHHPMLQLHTTMAPKLQPVPLPRLHAPVHLSRCTAIMPWRLTPLRP